MRAGEIVGLAGVSGNGQRELAQCLAGLRKVTAGAIIIDGKDLTHTELKAHIEAGLAYVPEERMRDGAIQNSRSKRTSFCTIMRRLSTHAPASSLNFGKMAAHATDLVKQFSVKTPSLDTPIKNLSGGNIQKLILARELSR